MCWRWVSLFHMKVSLGYVWPNPRTRNGLSDHPTCGPFCFVLPRPVLLHPHPTSPSALRRWVCLRPVRCAAVAPAAAMLRKSQEHPTGDYGHFCFQVFTPQHPNYHRCPLVLSIPHNFIMLMMLISETTGCVPVTAENRFSPELPKATEQFLRGPARLAVLFGEMREERMCNKQIAGSFHSRNSAIAIVAVLDGACLIELIASGSAGPLS